MNCQRQVKQYGSQPRGGAVERLGFFWYLKNESGRYLSQ